MTAGAPTQVYRFATGGGFAVIYDPKVHGTTCHSCRGSLAANGACYRCNPIR